MERPAVDDVVVQYVARYGGARPCKHLNTRTASLNIIRFRTGNQCNLHNVADIWSYFLVPVTRRLTKDTHTESNYTNYKTKSLV